MRPSVRAQAIIWSTIDSPVWSTRCTSGELSLDCEGRDVFELPAYDLFGRPAESSREDVVDVHEFERPIERGRANGRCRKERIELVDRLVTCPQSGLSSAIEPRVVEGDRRAPTYLHGESQITGAIPPFRSGADDAEHSEGATAGDQRQRHE
jgi:hypothetical protein